LPFFLLGAFVVYLWTRDIGGDLAATIAVFLYTTSPTILAFSSIAYTDIVAAATQLTAMFTFYRWLQRPDFRRTIVLGFALGIAFLAKLTTVLFVPAATLGIAAVWYARERNKSSRVPFATLRLVAALALAGVVLWAGYRFSLRPLQEATGINRASMPSFQHFPRPLRATAQALVFRNPRLPAPELLHGVALAWALDKSPSPSYLFGHLKSGGSCYFFLVGLGVKLPLPLLLLLAAAVVVLLRFREASALYPMVALGAVLLVTVHVSYQVGIRHILVAVPLITIVAGLGTGSLLQRENWRSAAAVAVIVLLLWQALESASAQSDFLAYFNQLAGKDPSSVLVTGCDLDCGQDLFRLARELHARNTSECTLLIWSSADITRSDLPKNGFENSSDVRGCVALSSRAFRLGDVLHHSYGPGYFSWLDHYQPVAIVGGTLRLYDIPQPLKTKGNAIDSKSGPSVRKL
jgi:4-amino-4-deoxy-L-arabinose transferase-like glycosyltransferase